MFRIPGRRSVSQVWRVALVGAIASVPATVVLNWVPNSGATPGGGVMIIGAMIAGAFAIAQSIDPGAAGLRTGLLGGVVAVLTFVVTQAATVTWSVSMLVFFGIAVTFVLCVSPLFGWVSGRVGGRIAGAIVSE